MSYATPRKNLYANPSVLYGDIPPGDAQAPIPGWGMNPYWAGPSRVGVGATDGSKGAIMAWLTDSTDAGFLNKLYVGLGVVALTAAAWKLSRRK